MANPTVLLETTSGDILIELYADKAPATVENFLKYVNEGFYANTIFHRVIKGFMIQGGGMNTTPKCRKRSMPFRCGKLESAENSKTAWWTARAM